MAGLAILSSSELAKASETKDTLSFRVQRHIEVVLEAQAALSSNAKSNQQIKELTQRLVTPIKLLKMEVITDDFSEWIDQSYTETVKLQASNLVESSSRADATANRMVTDATECLQQINDVKAIKLLARRKILLQGNKDFALAFRVYLLTKLSRPTIYRLNLGLSAANGLQDNILSRVVAALNIKLTPTFGLVNQTAKQLDLQSDKLDSQIVALAFARQIQEELNQFSKRESFGYGNLFSKFYTSDNPLRGDNPKNFPEIADQVQHLYEQCVIEKDGVLEITYDALDTLFYVTENLRVPTNVRPQNGTSLNLQNQPTAYLVIQNYPSAWQLIMTN